MMNFNNKKDRIFCDHYSSGIGDGGADGAGSTVHVENDAAVGRQ